LTGLLPQEHGVLDSTSCFLPDDLTTLAEVLQDAGCTTAAFSGNPLIVPGRNFDQGFEVFDHARAVTRKSRIVAPGALEWLEAVGEKRFFLYLHLTDPHSPLEPHPAGRALLAADVPDDFDSKALVHYAGRLLENCGHSETGERATERCVPQEHQRWIAELYDACVWTGDHWLGEVLEALERLDLDDNTIVAFTSDHGEELFDHGLGAHGQAVHRELIRVPLVIAGPGVPRGVRMATPVSNRHLAPTLAQLAGVAWSGTAAPTFLFEERPGEPVFFSTERGWWNGRYPQTILGLRQGDWVLHHAPDGAAWGATRPVQRGAGAIALYDRSVDPEERRDESAARPQVAAALKRLLLQRMNELEAARTHTAVPAGEATIDMLKGLGYLGDAE
jgi:arylsulfatase A-like enzyme